MKIQKVHVFNGQEVLEGLYDIYIEDHKISKICVHDPLSVSYGCEEETLNANGRWLPDLYPKPSSLHPSIKPGPQPFRQCLNNR